MKYFLVLTISVMLVACENSELDDLKKSQKEVEKQQEEVRLVINKSKKAKEFLDDFETRLVKLEDAELENTSDGDLYIDYLFEMKTELLDEKKTFEKYFDTKFFSLVEARFNTINSQINLYSHDVRREFRDIKRVLIN